MSASILKIQPYDHQYEKSPQEKQTNDFKPMTDILKDFLDGCDRYLKFLDAREEGLKEAFARRNGKLIIVGQENNNG